VVALALIPEAIAFSIIAGVDPKVGLYASFCICVIMAFIGGRPGQTSAATGAMAGCAMIATVVVVVWTHNLALGVFVGVLLAAIFFAAKVGNYMHVSSTLSADGHQRTYRVIGQVFFTSSEKFVESFDFKESLAKVTIDLDRAHFWDITSVAALDKVVLKFRREGAEVEVVGMNKATATVVDKFGVSDKPDAVDRLMGH